MGKILATLLALAAIGACHAGDAAAAASAPSGAELFAKNCAVCHAGGGNIIDPEDTLHKKDLDANGVKTAADIVKRMRNPGPRMTRFDPSVVSDEDARKIAEYILKTF